MAGAHQPPVVQVRCYAGYRGEETPRSFLIDDQEVLVAEIVESWRSPQGRYFRVRAEDGRLYVLAHNDRDDRWQLTVSS